METNHAAPLLETSEPESISEIARRTTRKLDHRIASICVSLAIIAYMDRFNIAYASQNLCEYLNINHKEYGTAISLFYVSYPVTNLTGNLIMRKMEGPARLALLCFIWGCVAILMTFVQSKAYFYAVRILLGIAEGGLFPAINYYLTLFYPEEYIAGVIALLVTGNLIASPISGAIAAGLLRLDGIFGLSGWRLLFFVEGLIPILFAPLAFLLLPTTPNEASFLNSDEKRWILDERTKFHGHYVERTVKEQIKIVTRHFYMWLVIASTFLSFGLTSVVGGWVVLIIEDILSLDNIDTGTCASATNESVKASLLSIVFNFIGIFYCLSLRFVSIKNRPMTVCAIDIVGGILLLLHAFFMQLSPTTSFIFLSISLGCMSMTISLFVSLNLSYFDHSAKATACSVINTFPTLGGAVFPVIAGVILDRYGYNVTITFSACALFLAGVIAVFPKENSKIQTNNRRDDVKEESTSFLEDADHNI